MDQIHHHPLNASTICCPEHVYELLSIYSHQNREEEVLSILIYFSENLETHFLLDNSEVSIDLKQKLGRYYNKLAIKRTLNLSITKQLFDTGFNLLSSVPETPEILGYLATATSNLAFIAKEEGNYEKAAKLLDKTLAIDKKIEDVTGEIMTRINKAAVLNEMGAYQEAYFTLRDSVQRLEKKVNDLVKGCNEKELKKSKKFKETLQLLLISLVNLVKASENVDNPAILNEAKARRSLGYDLSFRFLGETHQLTSFFFEPLRSDRTFSSFESNLDLSFHQSSKDFSASSQDNRKNPKKLTDDKNLKYSSQSSFSSKDLKKSSGFQTPVLENHEKPEKLLKRNQKNDKTGKVVKVEKVQNFKNLDVSIENSKVQFSPQSKSNTSFSQSEPKSESNSSKPTPQNPSSNQSSKPTFIRRKISKNSFKSSQNSPISPSQEALDAASGQSGIQGPSPVIRLPGSPLPFIPCRSWAFKARSSWSFTSITSIKSFEYLLDPLKSPIAKQFDFNIAGIKVVQGQKRVIICCLEINNSQPNLAITATSEESIEETFTSENIDLNDLKGILFFLCINDVIPSYMHPSFVNSFEKFCRFFLMPFIRIVEIQENNLEKIELWARGESLIPNENTQIFLNTECNVLLYFIEKFNLKLVICNASDEESNEKSLRVDVVLDEVAAGSLVRTHEIPVIYNNTRFVPCIENFSIEFMEHLDPIISEIELSVKDELGPRVLFDEFIEKNNYVLIRTSVSGQGFEKVIWMIQDNRKRLGWDIKIKTLHKANSSGRKRNFTLTYFYSYHALLLNFGVFVDRLEEMHVRILAYFVMEAIKVEMPADDEINGIETVGNVIAMPVKSLKSYRGFSKDQYKLPITLSIVGVNTFLIGVRASIFNVETCSEISAWLILDGNFYKHDQPKVKKIEKPKGALSVKLHETKLIDILEKEKGWEKIMACVKAEKNSIYILGSQGDTVFESLENVLIKGK